MAQTGYSKVQIYSSSTATHTPSAGNLTNDTNGSELAINITDGKLFYKDNSGTVQVLATKGSGVVGGSNTQVQYNSSGTFAGSANLTFDGTTLTSSGFSGPLNGSVGATTANTGAFTTVTAGTSVTTPFITSAAATNLLLKSAGTTAVTIDTSQKVTFANSIGFGSNAGITFNNSSALTNSTLNDYETGTWSPQITDSSGNTTGITYGNQFGRYTKVGNLVHVQGYFSFTSKGSLSGGMRLGNFPFVQQNVNNAYSAPVFALVSGLTGITTAYVFAGDFQPGTSNMALYYTNGNGTQTQLPFSGITNGFSMEFNFTYQATF